MIYVFDTSSFSRLKHFYPGVFKSVWAGLDQLVIDQTLISTREVWHELEGGNSDQHTNDWLSHRKQIFTTPSSAELLFVAQIFQVKHFRALIGETQRLKGTPVADPFVIACAKINQGTVVTEEQSKPNSAKIPNVCEHFNIPCVDLEVFMQQQKWTF
ncbi:MAG: DUF4411 family protein [bacterium]|nr:DUF4411 family protein [bacterium]